MEGKEGIEYDMSKSSIHCKTKKEHNMGVKEKIKNCPFLHTSV